MWTTNTRRRSIRIQWKYAQATGTFTRTEPYLWYAELRLPAADNLRPLQDWLDELWSSSPECRNDSSDPQFNPRVKMSCRDFIETGLFAEDRGHFIRISKLVQSLVLHQYSTQLCTYWRDLVGEFENVLNLRLAKLFADLFDVLPCGLDKSVLDHSTFDDTSLAAIGVLCLWTLLIEKVGTWPNSTKPIM